MDDKECLRNVVSYRNSTSNHNNARRQWRFQQVVSYRNSTSNHNSRAASTISAGVVSYRNSTSNHNNGLINGFLGQVVSYRNSTSNHNKNRWCVFLRLVVSYRNSTSNHNAGGSKKRRCALYLIEILHQTTTLETEVSYLMSCILSKFYIKPQLRLERELARCSCILSKFYIKPQLPAPVTLAAARCILSKFYIKPQLSRQWLMVPCVVSYRNSTSNHNTDAVSMSGVTVVSYRNSTSNHNSPLLRAVSFLLYLIEILHQTTTFCSTISVP